MWSRIYSQQFKSGEENLNLNACISNFYFFPQTFPSSNFACERNDSSTSVSAFARAESKLKVKYYVVMKVFEGKAAEWRSDITARKHSSQTGE